MHCQVVEDSLFISDRIVGYYRNKSMENNQQKYRPLMALQGYW